MFPRTLMKRAFSPISNGLGGTSRRNFNNLPPSSSETNRRLGASNSLNSTAITEELEDVQNTLLNSLSPAAQRTLQHREDRRRERRKVLSHFRQANIRILSEKEIQPIPSYNLVGRWPIRRAQLVESAIWLNKNIPVRIAHMIYGFRRLPFIIGCNEQIQEAHERYITSLDQLMSINSVEDPLSEDRTWENVQEYTKLLDELLVDHQKILPLMIQGFRDIHGYRDDNKAHNFLDNILVERLRIRLLCDHHVKILQQYLEYKSGGSTEYPRIIGIFDTKFEPAELCRNVYHEQEDACRVQYGLVPELSLKFKNNDTSSDKNWGRANSFGTGIYRDGYGRTSNPSFKYITQPLEYILKEVIKNAMRATVKSVMNDNYEIQPGAKMRPVKILVVQTSHGFIIKVSDRGSGIRAEDMENVWEYNWTENDDKDSDNFFNMVNTAGDDKRMFGYGCGLPISKIYAHTMGGSLELQSIETYGTDVVIRMPYLGNQQQPSKRNKGKNRAATLYF